MQAQSFRKAFESLRQHKMDLNVLFDLDPAYFLEHSEAFFHQLSRPDFIILFINSLNSTQTDMIAYILSPETFKSQSFLF